MFETVLRRPVAGQYCAEDGTRVKEETFMRKTDNGIPCNPGTHAHFGRNFLFALHCVVDQAPPIMVR
ncbi:unnamed protein product [Caenorhabditis auriculariae]|uniref:Uncharacterized protein n=1 Tax=Caenorhabditis auriculariae TaxID=2777116 RepID=A0A8S1H747_9PELO|nr:unnamed protein product [Caenorhabditis auriculariae]